VLDFFEIGSHELLAQDYRYELPAPGARSVFARISTMLFGLLAFKTVR
jgi:hypothetical protein